MKNIDILNRNFYDEHGNAIGLPNTFMYDKIMFGDYEMKEIDGELYAIAKKPLQNVGGKYQEVDFQTHIIEEIKDTVACSNGDLLFAFLTLIYNKLSEDSLAPNYAYTNKDLESIKSWCKKNGLPFCGKPTSIYISSTDELLKENMVGFSIKSFLELTNEIKDLFLYYQRIKGINNPNNVYNTMERKWCVFLFQKMCEHLNFKSYIDFTQGLHLKIYAENLVIACIYTMLLYLSSPNNAEIKQCGYCNAYFAPKRKNNKYCTQCSPQKAYSYRKRHEK